MEKKIHDFKTLVTLNRINEWDFDPKQVTDKQGMLEIRPIPLVFESDCSEYVMEIINTITHGIDVLNNDSYPIIYASGALFSDNYFLLLFGNNQVAHALVNKGMAKLADESIIQKVTYPVYYPPSPALA